MKDLWPTVFGDANSRPSGMLIGKAPRSANGHFPLLLCALRIWETSIIPVWLLISSQCKPSHKLCKTKKHSWFSIAGAKHFFSLCALISLSLSLFLFLSLSCPGDIYVLANELLLALWEIPFPPSLSPSHENLFRFDVLLNSWFYSCLFSLLLLLIIEPHISALGQALWWKKHHNLV